MKQVVFIGNQNYSLSGINTMSAYLKDIDRIPLLSREEEFTLATSYSECCQPLKQKNPHHNLCPKCTSVKNTLITANLRFVVSVAKKYQGNTLSLIDLINEGNLGLLTAVEKFNPSLGYHFISYGVWWIKQSIMKAISEKSRMIRLPMNRTNDLFKIAKFMSDYKSIHNKKPSEYEIEKNLGIPHQDIRKILEVSSGHASFEDISCNDNIEKISVCENHSNTEKHVISESLHENIQKLIETLPEREQIIISYRFGLDGKPCLSLSQIGNLLGLTKERVRQLEKQSLNTIKEHAIEQDILLYLL